MGQISRHYIFRPKSQLALTAAVASTPAIDMGEFIGGTIYIPVGSPITQLQFFGAPRMVSEPDPLTPAPATNPAPTFYPLFNSSGVQETLTVAAGNCYNLPADIFGFGSLKIVASAGGVGAVEISLKA